MTTLIVPDVHENIYQLERLIAHAGKHEQTVFLGDWFDSFEHTPETTQRTANWLLANHERPDYTFLWGNHDLPYAYPLEPLMCSGHSQATRVLLQQIPKIWDRFKLSVLVNGVRISHAGFTPGTGRGDIDRRCELALEGLKRGRVGTLLQAGWKRGGSQDVGGCTWLDWETEFRSINGTPQVVGHSRGDEPRWKDGSVCIDTDLKHYLVISDDGVLSVREVT